MKLIDIGIHIHIVQSLNTPFLKKSRLHERVLFILIESGFPLMLQIPIFFALVVAQDS